MFDIPVLFCTFNRIDTVKESFRSIQSIKPSRLYLSSDGPRPDKPGEYNLIKEVRDYLDNNINWPCDVFRSYESNNLGCGIKMSSAITWAFENEENLIILEDDCVADISFFEYCRELLERYKDDSKVMLIDGYRNSDEKVSDDSYFFSAVPEDYWGWATWKRVWSKYSYTIPDTDDDNIRAYLRSATSNGGFDHFLGCLKSVYKPQIHIWDYQFLYMLLKEQGLAAIPNTNLVHNAGIGENATHTFSTPQYYNSNVGHMEFPLTHPKRIEASSKYDKSIWRRSVIDDMIFRLKRALGLDPYTSIFG